MAKTAIGVAGRLRRQWLRWLAEHGEAYEYDATVGPTVEHVPHLSYAHRAPAPHQRLQSTYFRGSPVCCVLSMVVDVDS